MAFLLDKTRMDSALAPVCIARAGRALRFVIGATHRRLVPASFLAGAAALVLADLGSRTLIAPAELPVGAITGLVGAPFFLALLVRSRRTVL